MVPIAIGLNINWVAIGDRFNLYHARAREGNCDTTKWKSVTSGIMYGGDAK